MTCIRMLTCELTETKKETITENIYVQLIVTGTSITEKFSDHKHHQVPVMHMRIVCYTSKQHA